MCHLLHHVLNLKEKLEAACLTIPSIVVLVWAVLVYTFGSVDRAIRVLPKAVDNRLWLLVVNEWTSPLTYTLRGLDTLDGVSYIEDRQDKRATVAGGALRLTIPAQSVHVLRPE